MNNQYDIRDISLAPSGHRKIQWVKHNMPLLSGLEEEFSATKPFEGLRISLSVHLEAKTAYLCLVLAAGGAQMSVTGSNSLSTQDDVAAALADEGLAVFAYHGATDEEYMRHIEMCLEHKPHIIIDDGGDLVEMIHSKRPDLGESVLGGCEETTTGVIRLKAMEKDGVLKFPMVAVNDAKCKHLFDNRYGTGQSVWDSIMRNTNLIVASKTVVVVGYGWCSRGIAMRAAALGAQVIQHRAADAFVLQLVQGARAAAQQCHRCQLLCRRFWLLRQCAHQLVGVFGVTGKLFLQHRGHTVCRHGGLILRTIRNDRLDGLVVGAEGALL